MSPPLQFYDLRNSLSRLPNLADGVTDRHLCAFPRENLQHNTVSRRLQFVGHFFCLQFDDGFPALDVFPLAFEPTDDANACRWQPARLRHSQGRDDGRAS